METEIIISPAMETFRTAIRNMPENDWIDKHGSGTLRKNKRLGFVVKTQYLHERSNFEFGNGFEVVPRSRVTFGDAYSEADCKAVTEAGWFADRYITLNMAMFPEEHYQLKYLIIEESDGTKREGIGIVIRKTIAKWVMPGNIVCCIISEFDKNTKEYLTAINPL